MRTNEQRDEIKRYFGDLLIVDAPKDRTIILLPGDFDDTKRANDMHCGIAKCLYRNGCSYTLVLHGVGYADFPDEDGNLRVERFLIKGVAKEILEAFDRDGTKPAGRVTIRLKAPTPSQTLDAQRLRSRKTDSANREKRMRGIITGGRGSRNRLKSPTVIGQVRNGTGKVNMVYAVSKKVVK